MFKLFVFSSFLLCQLSYALEIEHANYYACADDNSMCMAVPKFKTEESSNTKSYCNRTLQILFKTPKSEKEPNGTLLDGWLYPFGFIGEFPSNVEDCRRTKLYNLTH